MANSVIVIVEIDPGGSGMVWRVDAGTDAGLACAGCFGVFMGWVV